MLESQDRHWLGGKFRPDSGSKGPGFDSCEHCSDYQSSIIDGKYLSGDQWLFWHVFIDWISAVFNDTLDISGCPVYLECVSLPGKWKFQEWFLHTISRWLTFIYNVALKLVKLSRPARKQTLWTLRNVSTHISLRSPRRLIWADTFCLRWIEV